MAIDPASPSPAKPHDGQAPRRCSLLMTRRFAPIFVSRCLGAFSATLIALLAAQAAGWSALAPAAALYALPIFVFAAPAGQLADKYDKATLARLVRLLGLLIAALAVAGVFWPSAVALFAALALLGLHATLSAPVDDALLAQQLDDGELVDGNALLAAGRTVALAGALAGALLADGGQASLAFAAALVAAAGLLASLAIPGAPPPAAKLVVDLNPWRATAHQLRLAGQRRSVRRAMLGIAWCAFCAALLLTLTPAYWRSVASAEPTSALLLLGALALGVGVGALLGAALSGRQLEIGLLPLAALGLAGAMLDLSFALPELAGAAPSGEARWSRVMLDLGGLGVFSAGLIVPLKVLIQSRSAALQRGRILAMSGPLNALSIGAGIVIASLLPVDPATLPWLCAALALGFVLFAADAYRLAPHRSLRFLTDLLIHSFYRVKKTGFEHIPASGPAVLVCNHVSFVDSVVIMAAVRRPIRFVIDHRIYETPLAHTLFRHSRTIPIATAKESPERKEAAFAEVARALKNGELIGLFPEGGITRSGEINHFRYGVGRIVSETPVPVIPMALRGLWGSFFSRRYGPAMSKPSLLRFLARIELVAGQAVAPQNVSPESLQAIVGQLRGDLA